MTAVDRYRLIAKCRGRAGVAVGHKLNHIVENAKPNKDLRKRLIAGKG